MMDDFMPLHMIEVANHNPTCERHLPHLTRENLSKNLADRHRLLYHFR